MTQQRAIKNKVFLFFKLNFLYQKSAEGLWNNVDSRATFVIDMFSYVAIFEYFICKDMPNFCRFNAHWFWKIWKKHLTLINMDLRDYSILGGYLQIVLPWITVLMSQKFEAAKMCNNFLKLKNSSHKTQDFSLEEKMKSYNMMNIHHYVER